MSWDQRLRLLLQIIIDYEEQGDDEEPPALELGKLDPVLMQLVEIDRRVFCRF